MVAGPESGSSDTSESESVEDGSDRREFGPSSRAVVGEVTNSPIFLCGEVTIDRATLRLACTTAARESEWEPVSSSNSRLRET